MSQVHPVGAEVAKVKITVVPAAQVELTTIPPTVLPPVCVPVEQVLPVNVGGVPVPIKELEYKEVKGKVGLPSLYVPAHPAEELSGAPGITAPLFAPTHKPQLPAMPILEL